MVFRKPLVAALMAATVLSLPALAIEGSLKSQEAIDNSAAASQQKIDNLADQAASDLQAYRLATQRLESLSIYNEQMKKLLQSQEAEITSIQRQTEEIDNIETGALPLMIRMTETLTEIVQADVPFLKEERAERIANLRELIDRADVTAGEKYRRILEAYSVELDYGRTIEAYRGELNSGSEPRTVDFLKIGRTGLYYQSLDGQESGRWNAARGAWELVDKSYLNKIRDGLRIARKQAPPELLVLPVTAPAL